MLKLFHSRYLTLIIGLVTILLQDSPILINYIDKLNRWRNNNNNNNRSIRSVGTRPESSIGCQPDILSLLVSSFSFRDFPLPVSQPSSYFSSHVATILSNVVAKELPPSSREVSRQVEFTFDLNRRFFLSDVSRFGQQFL